MPHRVKIPDGAFTNWPAFEQKLREELDASMAPAAVGRVMARTQRAFAALQLPNLVSSFELEEAARLIRFEAWSHDFRASQAKMFASLILSFVALEER